MVARRMSFTSYGQHEWLGYTVTALSLYDSFSSDQTMLWIYVARCHQTMASRKCSKNVVHLLCRLSSPVQTMYLQRNKQLRLTLTFEHSCLICDSSVPRGCERSMVLLNVFDEHWRSWMSLWIKATFYPKLLWIKASAKCPKCKCKWMTIKHN